MNASPTNHPDRILIVGRSPSVLLDAVEILRNKGYSADATNQFDRVLDDYDVTNIDIVVFGGMVPPDTKQYLREQISHRNGHVTFVQGLAGIAGLIAAQVEAVASDSDADQGRVTYLAQQRAVELTLNEPAHVTIEAWWTTSFTPPEPKSTSMLVLDDEFDNGTHVIPLPSQIPSEASFVTVAVDSTVRAFTVGAMPNAIPRMVQLPPVQGVTTRSEPR